MTDLPIAAEHLDSARRAWLAGLEREHGAARSPETALALARGQWQCGEYDAALAHFREACELAPDWADAQLSLVRAASMLGLRELELSSLNDARRRHPEHADLALHAALHAVPAFDEAEDILRPHAAHPLIAAYRSAFRSLATGKECPPDRNAGERLAARLEGLRWLQRQTQETGCYVGDPVQVLERALALASVSGLTLECGVYFGRSLRIIAAGTQGTVHGFDSFEGLPEAWKPGEPAGAYSTGGRLPELPGNVTLHRGWFENTLPRFFATQPGDVRLLHVDCDLYSSTRCVLQNAEARIVRGTVLVFDDLLGYPGFEQHELRAFEEFARRRELRWRPVAACVLGREVAVQILG